MIFSKATKHVRINLKRSRTTSSDKINPVVTVKEGKLRGILKKLNNGKEFYSFKGIPYAQPPVGDLRFKAPLPPKPWSGILDTLEHGANCPHYDILMENIKIGDENCLFLNVYTLSIQTDSKLPVMVFIHAGGFCSGSGDEKLYGPEYLLQHNVILVTINYRLEALGFLCLDTPEVPGNAGMKDQVAALRWVQKNIAQFGGDPDNVTIFGESAGAACVTYHMLSPMTKGLFHKAIAQSGSCLSDYALDLNPTARAFRVGKFLGSDTKDPKKLLNYLQSLPSNKFISLNMATATKEEQSRELPIFFAPVVEKKLGDNEVFLPEKPLDMMLAGKFHPIPFITGYNSSEGLIVVQKEIQKVDFINKQPSCLVPKEIYMNVSVEKLLEFGERIKQFYWGNRDLTADDIEIITEILTDKYFLFGIYRQSEYYSKYSRSIYMYRFNLVTELNWFQQSHGLTTVNGVSHFDELFYIFSNDFHKDIYQRSPKLQEYIYQITKLWTNFVKTINPTPDSSLGIKWPLYTPSNGEYLHIEKQLSIGKDAEKERLDFWAKLYADAGLPGITRSNK